MNEQPQSQPLIAILALIVACVLWSGSYVIIRFALKDYSPGAMALLRYLVASFCILFFYFRPNRKNTLPLRYIPYAMFIGVLGIGIYNVTLNYAELTVNSGTASFVTGLSPVISAALSIIFLHEKVSRQGWLGFAVSLCGVFLIACGEAHGFALNIGLLFLFVATVVSSLYSVLQKPLLKMTHAFDLVSWIIWGGTIPLLVFLPQLCHQLPHVPWHTTFWVVMNGIFPAAISYALWSYTLHLMPLSRAVAFLYTVPVFTTLLAFFTLGELPQVIALIGGVVAVTGTALVNMARIK